MKIQKSIGINSLGNQIWVEAGEAELEGLYAAAAADNHYEIQTVRDKIAAGRTIWLDQRRGLKLRGYNEGGDEKIQARYEQRIAAVRAADGYESGEDY